MFPESGPTYSITEAASWKCDDADQQQRGLVAVTFSLRPAPEARIAQALYELRTLTRGRVNREASEDEAEALIWTQNLRQYPADIVLQTLKSWPSRSDGQWWPTWHDILKIVEAETASRRMLAEHIRSGKCLPAPKPQEVERDDSPEAIARRQQHIENCRSRWDWKQIADGKEPLGVDPVNPIDDYLGWEAREKSRLADESKSGKFRLSDEALGISRRRTERDAA